MTRRGEVREEGKGQEEGRGPLEEAGPQALREAAREMNEGRGPAGLRLNLMSGGASSSPALVKRR